MRADELSIPLFAAGFALAALVHQAAAGSFTATPTEVGVLVAAVAVLLVPRSYPVLALLAAAELLDLARELPYVSNHWLFLGFLGLAVLVAGLAADRERALGPTVRASALVVYAFALVHKLNTSYLDPATSCGAEIAAGIAAALALPIERGLVERLAIPASLAVEAAVPLLLLGSRTRTLGLALGVAFHGLLALYPGNRYYNFSAAMLAAYLAFAPADSPLARSWSAWIDRRDGRLHRGVVVVALASGSAVFVLADAALVDTLLRALWAVLALGLVTLWLRGAGRPEGPRSLARLLGPRPRLAALVPLLLAVNAAGPYLGFKTETSFAMYSNLRTERVSNHLVIRRPLFPDWQDDWVTIVESEDPLLDQIRRRGYALVRFQLASLLADRGHRRTVIEYRGERHEWAAGGALPAFLSPPPFWLRKSIYFRPIPAADGADRCEH